MNPNLRTTLIGSAIAVLVATPAWAEDTLQRSDSVPQGDIIQPLEATPGTGAPADVAPDMASPDPAVGGNPLYARTPEELRGLEVVDLAGKKVGKVKTLVLGADGQSAHAVISSGGFLGLGAREIVVSLDQLQLLDGRLQAGTSVEDASAAGSYEPDEYVELQPDRPISEFSAFEPVPE